MAASLSPPADAAAGRGRRRRTRALLLAWLLIALSGPAAAQQSDPIEAEDEDLDLIEEPVQGPAPPPTVAPDIEEIIVKGQRAGKDLQDESVSGTVFSQEDLRALRIQNIEDVANVTPNLEINTAFAASNPTLFIRGIGLKDYNANAAGAVAIYQDGVPLSFPAIQLFQLFDQRNVEVRLGPDGNLQGATAGAILVESVLPGDEFAANLDFSYGNLDQLNFEGGVTIPLVEDLLSTRLSFVMNARDGTTDNVCADWNPQANFPDVPTSNPRLQANGGIDSTLVTRETLLREYEKDRDAGILPANLRRYTVPDTGRNRRRNLPPGVAPTVLIPDGVCIVRDPGFAVVTAAGAAADPDLQEGDIIDALFTEVSDLQGLKRRINNVDDWAARGIIAFTPTDTMQWLLNVHGGVNRSDARHLQMLGAQPIGAEDPTLCPDPSVPCGFDATLEQGFSEANAARILEGAGRPNEGVRSVDGLGSNRGFPGEGGADPFVGYYNRDGRELIDTYGASIDGNMELGALSLRSVTGYEWYDRLVEDEADANPLDVFPAIYDDSGWQVSQEFKLLGQTDDLDWTAGAFFLYSELESTNDFEVLRFLLTQDFEQEFIAGAPYLAGTYRLNDELSLDGSVRYNFMHKTFDLESRGVGLQSGIAIDPIEPASADDSWNAPSGGLTLNYEPVWDGLDAWVENSIRLYAKYSRGMKPGHFNASLTIPSDGSSVQEIGEVDPEFIHAIELGWKTSWWEERMRFNVALFRYWYQDLQVFDITNEADTIPQPELLNADARVLGAEVDLELRPIPEVWIDLSFGWLDSEFEEFTVEKRILQGRRDAQPQKFNYKGNPLIASPEYSFNGIIEIEIPLGRYGSLVPNYNANYRSKIFLDPQAIDPISQPAYWLHNARLSWRHEDGRLEVAGWVQNFMDEQYKVDVFDITREFDSIIEVWSEPRLYGFTVSMRF